MKTYPKERSKTQASNQNHKKARQVGFEDPDRIAEELERLARQHLPDRVLQGVMTGHEADIRQDATLLALGWYLRNESSLPTQAGHAWHAPRAIAGALKIIKRDYIKSLKGEEEALHEMLPHVTATACHPVMIRSRNWPTSTMRHLARKAIRIALRKGKISSLNAAIAMEVLVDGVPVAEIATRCQVHRSNIYQHLTRARLHIPAIIERLEVSLHDVR